MKPVIGIFPFYDEENDKLIINRSYMDSVLRSGGIPFAISLSDNPEIIYETMKHLDGIIFTGGSDIDPSYYGESNSGKSIGILPFLDKCESITIRLCMEADIPVLGICRGMQALNVFCGGNLIQDIPSERGIAVIHNLEKPDVAFHKIKVEKASPLSDAIGFGEHLINSYHHQAVKEPAEGFSVCSVSEDGIIESIYHKEKKFVLGVQWHPERDNETAVCNKKIIDYFINFCLKDKKEK